MNIAEYIGPLALIDKAAFALRRRRAAEDRDDAALVNRALQVYDAIQTELEKGHVLYFHNADDTQAFPMSWETRKE